MSSGGPRSERLWWLPPIVFLVNLCVLGLLVLYSSLNLKPYVSTAASARLHAYHRVTLALAVVLPTVASVAYLWPIRWWLRRVGSERPATKPDEPPAAIVGRTANAPIALASASLLSWGLVAVAVVARLQTSHEGVTVGLWAHFIARPFLAGLIAAVSVFFAAEYVCRTRAWPTLLAATRIEGNAHLWKIRVTHRFLLLWLAISFLPLSVVALTAVIRMDSLDLAGDPTLGRIMSVIILIAASAALGGAALAWLLSRTVMREGPTRRSP